jgi:hypothetical protein
MKWFAIPLGLVAWGGYLSLGAVSLGHFQVQKWAKGVITGNGVLKKESRTVGEYDSISIGAAMKGRFTEKGLMPLSIEAESNLLPLVATRVEGRRLIIELRGNVSTNKVISISGSSKMIKELQASGASNVNLLQVKSHPLNLQASGASRITVDGLPNELKATLSGASSAVLGKLVLQNCIVELSGASRLSISGTTQMIRARLGGASTLDGGLRAKSGEVEASGASTLELTKSSNIRSRLSGLSKLR